MEWNSDGSGMELIFQKFELEQTIQPDELEMIRVLAERISEMLDKEPDLLFSTLYRLDVYESKINHVLKSPFEDPATGLARLVVERQKEKLRTRRAHGGKPEDPPETE